MKTKQQGARKGFTLIELLVVIAIIGLLASIILASLDSARKKGRDARRVADMKEVQLALELYYDASSTFPVGATQVVVPTGSAPSSSSLSAVTGLSPTYISSVPTDPLSSAGYYYQYQSLTSSNAACSTAPCSNYVLVAALESAANTSGWTGTAGTATCSTAQNGGGYMYCVHN